LRNLGRPSVGNGNGRRHGGAGCFNVHISPYEKGRVRGVGPDPAGVMDYPRLMFISSVSISSAVVMIRELAW
jgi:hypothetical protein